MMFQAALKPISVLSMNLNDSFTYVYIEFPSMILINQMLMLKHTNQFFEFLVYLKKLNLFEGPKIALI